MDLQSIKQRFGIVGSDPQMDFAIERALLAAPTELTVLVTGESGVGKEYFPQIIHANSPRKHGTYIAINCGAIPEGTIDGELFGHKKGGFTGAVEDRKGYFEMADKGTIFLDEVAELPMTTQARLLRVLQKGEFMKVGSSVVQTTDIRVVAATNVDLRDAVAKGTFRFDLYQRLNGLPIWIPPLRERKGDIYLLFRKFATDTSLKYRMPAITLDEDARQLLENYPWPGNVRQLKSIAEQISVLEKSRTITAGILRAYLPESEMTAVPMVVGSEFRQDTDRDLLYKILFDMKNELNDLRKMVAELTSLVKPGTSVPSEPAAAQVTPLLTSGGYSLPAVTATPFFTEPAKEEEFAETEEVTEEPEVLTKEKVQRDNIVRALRKHHGRRKEAAKELFISERTLYRRMKELGITGY